MCSWRRLAAVLLIALAPGADLRAQVTVSGEATVTIGSRDDTAFFNYTDYEHNALRMFRLSLAGMWRPSSRLALLTELRSEDVQEVIPYAVYARVKPLAARAIFIQVGRIPPVFGTFGRRSYGTDGNPLIGYPLAYQYLTALRPDAIPASADDLLAMRARGWRAFYPVGDPNPGPGVPLVSAYRWDTGVEAHGISRHVDGSVALTRGTLSNPRVRDDNHGLQLSARIAWKPIVGLVVGGSASRGEFLARAVTDTLVPDAPSHLYTQRAFALDSEYSRDHWIVRGEIIHSGWTLPAIAQPYISNPLNGTGAFVETRYRFTPRYYAAARVDRLTFSRISGQRFFAGAPTPWDAPVTRLEAGGGVSIFRNLTVRAVVQHNSRDAGRVKSRTFLSGQLAVWF
jgi:hypothetical protein